MVLAQRLSFDIVDSAEVTGCDQHWVIFKAVVKDYRKLVCLKHGTYEHASHNISHWIMGNLILKGNSRQILLSEMSLPGIEVLIGKLLPKILGRLGKENHSKRQCKVALVQRKCAVTSSVSVQFLYAPYN